MLLWLQNTILTSNKQHRFILFGISSKYSNFAFSFGQMLMGKLKFVLNFSYQTYVRKYIFHKTMTTKKRCIQSLSLSLWNTCLYFTNQGRTPARHSAIEVELVNSLSFSLCSFHPELNFLDLVWIWVYGVKTRSEPSTTTLQSRCLVCGWKEGGDMGSWVTISYISQLFHFPFLRWHVLYYMSEYLIYFKLIVILEMHQF